MQTNVPAPDFSLKDTSGRLHRLADYLGRMVVLNFWSAECPWSARADAHLLELSREFGEKLVILPVASNLNETPELIAQAMQQRELPFVLLDENCFVADLYSAQTTPHCFVVDSAGYLRYQGAVDDVTFRKRQAEQYYVEDALTALVAGKIPERSETPVYGCTIIRHG